MDSGSNKKREDLKKMETGVEDKYYYRKNPEWLDLSDGWDLSKFEKNKE